MKIVVSSILAATWVASSGLASADVDSDVKAIFDHGTWKLAPES